MEQMFNLLNVYLNEATAAIVNLREQAEEIREKMDNLIDACETIENEL